MNFNKKKLKELKKLYEILTWKITKKITLDKKFIPPPIYTEYNLVLDLIEDLEEAKKDD